MKFKVLVLVLACVLSACGGAATTASTAPTNAPAPTDAPAPATEAPSEAPPVEAPTEAPVVAATEAPTTAPSEAPSETATQGPAPARATATPASTGPLAAQIFVANCRSAPTTDKPGNVVVQISVEATGGNVVYTYVYNDVAGTNKFIEIPWELGSRLLGKVTVQSGDGQSVVVELNVDLKDLECP